MTREQLLDVWQRYMHRADLAADLDVVMEFTISKINDRLLTYDARAGEAGLPDTWSQRDNTWGEAAEDLLLKAPRLFLHGGLCFLAELAMNDAQLGKEEQLFEGAAAGYLMRVALDAGPADPFEVRILDMEGAANAD